jgi:hypothetical protein
VITGSVVLMNQQNGAEEKDEWPPHWRRQLFLLKKQLKLLTSARATDVFPSHVQTPAISGTPV